MRPTFFGDVLVREQERHLFVLLTQLRVQYLQIVPEWLLIVSTTQRYFKHFALRSERSQSTDALFTAAADTDEKGVTLRHAEDAMDARQVVQGVVEENHLHRRLGLIVTLQDL